ncbi:glutamate transport system permease protein [Psychromicrobium silvestre]|uniref:Glutamate transport system permease protein n=1 Tax=Psychromicrobium silvestre TaxID=1645614 RepID=A0A7Y9S6L0_9MICC|nr:amino acid ABC transporter permease [Psychromicrobium silvestre]NYE95075.1 glutamate transport system permease protein [Psychromicrobium silvestre]
MSSVLFDAPGVKAIRRNRILGVVTIVVIAAVLAFIIYKFAESGQFSAKKWQLFTFPLVQQNILKGLGSTLSAFAVAAVGSLILGMVLAVGRLSDRRWISRPVGWFTELFRAIPLLILMALMFYGLGSIGVQGISPFTAVVVGLILYNGSVLAEIFRAGIQAVPKGQSEAAYALGLRKTRVMTMILLPQAVRTMLPVIIAQLVVALKDTALGFIITYQELLYQINYLGSQTSYQTPIIPAALVGGAIYVGCCLILAGLAKYLEGRMRRSPKVSNKNLPVVPGAGNLDGGNVGTGGNT